MATAVVLTGTDNVVAPTDATALAALARLLAGRRCHADGVRIRSRLLASGAAAGEAVATGVVLLVAANIVTAAQATQLAGLNDFQFASGATLVVADNAANLLASTYASGLRLATSVSLTGTDNIVTAAQATTLVGMPGFALATAAILQVADTAANLLAGVNATGIAIASSVSLTGRTNTVTAAQATAPVGSGRLCPRLRRRARRVGHRGPPACGRKSSWRGGGFQRGVDRFGEHGHRGAGRRAGRS